MTTQKNKPKLNHWIQTFGKANGYRVLKEIKDFAGFIDNNITAEQMQGRQQMMQFITDKLKASAGKKETYASIIYEVELL